MLNFILQHMCAFSQYQLIRLASMLLKVGITLLVGAPFVTICSLLWLQHLYRDLVGKFIIYFGNLAVHNFYLHWKLRVWRVRCCFYPEHACLLPASCLNVGLYRADQCFPCDMPYQNLSWVDWCNKIYFNFSVQLIDDVLTLLGTNFLDQLLPWCSHITSRCLVTIVKDIVS